MVDTSHTPALGYVQIVQQRDAATLLPIIVAHVAQGTIIHSDEWRSYSQVATLPPVSGNQTVNHSVTFVDPVTGTYPKYLHMQLCVYYRGSYPEHRVILEQSKNKVKANERLSFSSASELSR